MWYLVEYRVHISSGSCIIFHQKQTFSCVASVYVWIWCMCMCRRVFLQNQWETSAHIYIIPTGTLNFPFMTIFILPSFCCSFVFSLFTSAICVYSLNLLQIFFLDSNTNSIRSATDQSLFWQFRVHIKFLFLFYLCFSNNKFNFSS